MTRVPIRLHSFSKYRSQRTDGYASKREARRASELELLERLGEIRGLQKQVSFELIPAQAGERAVRYIADFVYERQGTQVVEDAKGMKTPVYRLKRRLMKHLLGITIEES